MNLKEQYKLFDNISQVDISEQDILDYSREVLENLLIDHTMTVKARLETGDQTKSVNIFWATNDYVSYGLGGKTDEGNGFTYKDQIQIENITGRFKRIVMPRVLKDKELQIARSKDKAEVFTPSWVCNAQNNLVDEAWFGRKDVFNREVTLEDGTHSWIPTEGKIQFPEGDKQKTWRKYVTDNRMEITCGEAPYLVSRYDTTTGETIPINRRIGLLDRKFRIISENVTTEQEWYDMAEKAIKHTYGYEWQGDNLLLAREALLYTFIEYYIDKFNEKDENGQIILVNVPEKKRVIDCAKWISWNIWQMDGIKMVVPDSCHDDIYKPEATQTNLFAPVQNTPVKEIVKRCPGCVSGDVHKHNGTYCIIRDWCKHKPKDWKPKQGEDPNSSPWQIIKFKSLLNQGDLFHEQESESEEE